MNDAFNSLHDAHAASPEEADGIALIAHDNCKDEMIEWTRDNRDTLSSFTLYATGTTGKLLEQQTGLTVRCMMSGPYGGDAQIGALLVEGRVCCLFFFWDPLTPQPHEPDVKALLRLAVLHNIPTACNRTTADFLISSPLFPRFLRQGAQPSSTAAVSASTDLEQANEAG